MHADSRDLINWEETLCGIVVVDFSPLTATGASLRRIDSLGRSSGLLRSCRIMQMRSSYSTI